MASNINLMQPMEFEREELNKRTWSHTLRTKLQARRWTIYGAVGFFVLILLGFSGSWLSAAGGRTAGEATTGTGDPTGEATESSGVTKTLWDTRADAVKDAFKKAYTFYDTLAAPHDELRPLTKAYQDNFNGWGVTAVDSLDTMLIMGLYDLSNKTVSHIAQLAFRQDKEITTFETIIRYVGGLLSAYALTKHPILLTKADELGQILLPIFDTPSGLPILMFNTATGASRDRSKDRVYLSEIASCQLEFRYLAHLTGRKEYIEHVDRISHTIFDEITPERLLPIIWNKISGEPQLDDSFSLGAFGDSAYEYIIKQYIQTNRTESLFRSMHIATANGIIDHLLYLSPRRKLLYATSLNRGIPSHRMHHLTCFYAGILALGVHLMPDLPARHMWAAEGLAHTCYILYRDTETKLGPDEVEFMEEGDRWAEVVKEWEEDGEFIRDRDLKPPGVEDAVPVEVKEEREYRIVDSYSPLRPEAIESWYVLYRLTGNMKWRERGWEHFQAIEKSAKVTRGYAALSNADSLRAPKKDEMPSFFLAETLKYMYLLFSETEVLSLDDWTFNTEAHPLPVFSWAQWEKDRYGIKVS